MKTYGFSGRRILGLFMLTAYLVAAGCGSAAGENGQSRNDESNGAGDGVRVENDTEKTEDAGVEQDIHGDGREESGISYTSHGITVSLPAKWQERYLIIEDENGFSVYQKASYEMLEGMGYLFGLCRVTEYWNYGAGETLLAYTEDGTLYYLMQPTDFPCDPENQELCDEYRKMAADVERIADSVSIEEKVLWDANEYVIPVSGILTLPEDVLLNYSDNELWLAKNEIYARHGRKFKNEFLQGYFDCCSWYEGTVEPEQFSESVLNESERENVERIAARAGQLAEENPYPREYRTGETAKVDLQGNGVFNEVSYQVADVFYITDIATYQEGLEIAVLDDGPSGDPETHFFRYDGSAPVYLGAISGFPFPEQNFGRNGFDGMGGIAGRGRVDLIETAYVEDYWRYDYETGKIEKDDGRLNPFYFYIPHELYVDLPVHHRMDAASETEIISAGQKVYFLLTDGAEWILVKGKDGTAGYIQVREEAVTGLSKPASEVFSGLAYFD